MGAHLPIFHPEKSNGFLSVPKIRGARTIALAAVLCTASALPSFAQDNSDNNEQLGEALGNLLINSISQAVRDSAQRGWANLDPALLNCLETQYSLDPDQLASQGIGPGAARFKPDVKECKRLLAPPPLQIEGFAEGPDGTYTRTGEGLPKIASRFAARVVASGAGDASREARFNALQSKVQSGCAGDYSISVIHFYFGGDEANSKANGIHEKWADAEVECSIDPPDPDNADALTIDDLTNGNAGAQFFTMHSAILNAPFKKAFESVVDDLRSHSRHMARSDKDKGIIVTGEPEEKKAAYSTSYFIVLAPDTDATTRITFKLVEGSLEPMHNAPTLFHPQGHEVAETRAQQFIAEIEQRLGGGHV